MSIQQTGGDLHRVFPQEVRDHIYGYVLLGQAYIAAGGTFTHSFMVQMGLSPGNPKLQMKLADLAILRSSKLVYQEAKLVLYKKGVFRFYLDFFELESETFSKLTQEAADLMMNIEILINMTCWDDYCGVEPDRPDLRTVNDKLGAVIAKFSSLRVLRNSCTVRFCFCTGEYAYEVLDTGVVECSIQKLVGFSTMVLQVESFYPNKKSIMKDLAIAGDRKEGEFDYQEFAQNWMDKEYDVLVAKAMELHRDFYEAVKDRFDGVFEPSETDIQLHTRNLLFFGHLKYYPRQHIVNKIRVEALRLATEANSLDSGDGLGGCAERSTLAKFVACQTLPTPSDHYAPKEDLEDKLEEDSE